jgi:hypothetical protein
MKKNTKLLESCYISFHKISYWRALQTFKDSELLGFWTSSIVRNSE